jgi:hypothetical protein
MSVQIEQESYEMLRAMGSLPTSPAAEKFWWRFQRFEKPKR